MTTDGQESSHRDVKRTAGRPPTRWVIILHKKLKELYDVQRVPRASRKHWALLHTTGADGGNTGVRWNQSKSNESTGADYGGRRSDGSAASGAVSTTSGSSTPAPVRRSRSSHDGLLKCQFCPKKWADQNALHTHMTDCRMMRGHECSQCGKRFKARGGLQQHLRIHSNDRPYACHFCAKRFTQKSHVDQHERIHTGTKPFTCQFCGRAFRQRSQQLGHEATHSNAISNTHQSTAQSTQQRPSSTEQSKSQHDQERDEILGNELLQQNPRPNANEQPTTTGEQLGLLALNHVNVTPSSTSSAALATSILALSHNQMSTSHSYHFPTSNYLHQGATIGLLNGLH